MGVYFQFSSTMKRLNPSCEEQHHMSLLFDQPSEFLQLPDLESINNSAFSFGENLQQQPRENGLCAFQNQQEGPKSSNQMFHPQKLDLGQERLDGYFGNSFGFSEKGSKNQQEGHNIVKASKQYSKEYRQKKKKYISDLQEENRFLKKKVDELSYRLRQADLELNRIKNQQTESNTHLPTHQIQKQKLIKELQERLSKQTRLSEEEILEYEKKIDETSYFFGKEMQQRQNYLITQLYENFIDDCSCFFVQSLYTKKYLWSEDMRDLRKIDAELMEVHEINSPEKLQWARKNSFDPEMTRTCYTMRDLMRKFYKTYIEIVALSDVIRRQYDKMVIEWKNNVSKMQGINEFLYFSKIRYRRDMRQIRQEWMLGIMNGQSSDQDLYDQGKICSKKVNF